MKNMKIMLLGLTLMLAACGKSYPVLTHFEFQDDRSRTTFTTSDSQELTEMAALFYDRTEVDDPLVAPDFKYLVGVEVEGKKERWRCSKDGYCRIYVQGDTPIYKLERFVELYEKVL